ncbi:hypothetical protein P9112_014049 [Eukaryota sp. TZLM1-RC]
MYDKVLFSLMALSIGISSTVSIFVRDELQSLSENIFVLFVLLFYIIFYIRTSHKRDLFLYSTRLGLSLYFLYAYISFTMGRKFHQVYTLDLITVIPIFIFTIESFKLVSACTFPSNVIPNPKLFGYHLVVTSALVALSWLSMLIPFSITGDYPDVVNEYKEAAVATFFKDVAIVCPLVIYVGVGLVTGRTWSFVYAISTYVFLIPLTMLVLIITFVQYTEGWDMPLAPVIGSVLVPLISCGFAWKYFVNFRKN